MAIMQGGDVLFWGALAFLMIVVTTIGTWYLTIIGRDRPTPKLKRGEKTVVRYAGLIDEDRSPLPKFLTYTIVLSIVWAILYALWTGINGLGT